MKGKDYFRPHPHSSSSEGVVWPDRDCQPWQPVALDAVDELITQTNVATLEEASIAITSEVEEKERLTWRERKSDT